MRPQGSPPYTWGARIDISKESMAVGITPIYMGSTLINDVITSLNKDHPHIHGEHLVSKPEP